MPMKFPDIWGVKKPWPPKYKIKEKHKEWENDDDMAYCILCGKEFTVGEDGNELGFCIKCQEKPDFPYDLDKYYEDYDNDKVTFKGFETMSRGILENYRKSGL